MNDSTIGQATVRARVTLDLVIDGRLVTIDQWVTLGDSHPLHDIGVQSLAIATRDTLNAAGSDAMRALGKRLAIEPPSCFVTARAAVLAEREACAEIADVEAHRAGGVGPAIDIAAAILARK